MLASIKRFVIWLCTVLLLLQHAAVAQTQFPDVDLDIDPPVIDHEALEVGVAGETQLFSALIIDDKGIEYVDLYYRPDRGSDYTKIGMQPSGDTRYVASVPTELAQSSIEYYIEAADTGGNRVLKGFPFFPLVRNLDVPAPPAPIITSSTGSEAAGATGSSRLLYILLGALAVGLLASSGGNGGGGSGEEVPLTINISSPTN